MTTIDGIYTNELSRLERGPSPGEDRHGYFIVDVDVHCPSNAAQVLERCREVMRAVLSQPEDPWPPVDRSRQILPRWFVDAGGEEIRSGARESVNDALKQMPAEELEKAPWPAGAWVNTFEDGRSWFWWDATVVSPDRIHMQLAVEGHPWSEGDIRWLLIAAGATSVSFIDVDERRPLPLTRVNHDRPLPLRWQDIGNAKTAPKRCSPMTLEDHPPA